MTEIKNNNSTTSSGSLEVTKRDLSETNETSEGDKTILKETSSSWSTKIKAVRVSASYKKNNSFLVVTDDSGAEIIYKYSGGLFVKHRAKKTQKTITLMANTMIKDLLDKNLTYIFYQEWIYKNKNALLNSTTVKNILENHNILKVIAFCKNLKTATGFIKSQKQKKNKRRK